MGDTAKKPKHIKTGTQKIILLACLSLLLASSIAAISYATESKGQASADSAAAQIDSSSLTDEILELEQTQAVQTLAKETGLETIVVALASNQDIDISWYTSNTNAQTFTISTPAELRGLAALVNGTATDSSGNAIAAVDFEGKTINQSTDIVLASYNESTGTFSEEEYTPIGTLENPFAGTYDGNEHSIEGLSITSIYSYAGLFGYASDTSTIQNVEILQDESIVSYINLETSDQLIRSIGSVVGKTDGDLINCSSSIDIVVHSTTQSNPDELYVVRFVGGIAGYSTGDISNCSFTGSMDALIETDSYYKTTSTEDLRVADSFGGIVGRFGDPETYGELRDCLNTGSIWVRCIGAGAEDAAGSITTYARPFFVAGIAGYSNGSIYDCVNGSYNELDDSVTGIVNTSATDSVTGDPLANRGGDQVAGIVGGFRSVSDDEDKDNDGSPDHPVIVQNCLNLGKITGCVSVGGIAAECGVYTTVTQCRNGMAGQDTPGNVICTRWNKPISGGVVGRTWSGIVSYCANYGTVENTQSGYYVAGICGAIFVSDDYPEALGEVYGCMNVGSVFTHIGTQEGVEYREGGIVGANEGYVHDCVMLEGTVPTHDDSAIGDRDWGMYSNLEVMTQSELQSSAAAALLNTQAIYDGDFTTYWFINQSGYPVLNVWVDEDELITTRLTADMIEKVNLISDASYVGGDGGSIPELEVELKDGTILVQGADFVVIPDENGIEMSSGGAYWASIQGIGMYSGIVEDVCSYDIGKADLSTANIQIDNGKYNFGSVVMPETIRILIGGVESDSTDYSYVVYDSSTTAINLDGYTFGDRSSWSGAYAVYDSEGFISYDGGETLEDLPDVASLNAETRSWTLYDRWGNLISDSDGNVYYTEYTSGVNGAVVNNRTSCVRFVSSGTPAGYIVQLTANDDAETLEGTGVGYYNLDTVSIRDECTVTSASCQGITWVWDSDQKRFNMLDDNGDIIPGYPVATFTGESIIPSVSLEYNGYVLVEGTDYRLTAGDPEPEEGSLEESEGYLNRNVTGENVTASEVKACMTIRPVDTYGMNNYILAYFYIDPADLDDCDISIEEDSYDYTGEAIEPAVTVSLNGVELIEDLDYTISYSNNVEIGTATITVTPLTNLSGGDNEPREITFEITDPEATTPGDDETTPGESGDGESGDEVSVTAAAVDVDGETRIQTAINTAKEAYPNGTDGVIIAYAFNYADALAASGLAGALDYPILLANTNTASDDLLEYLRSCGASRVIIVGGNAVVSDDVASEIASAVGSSVTRLYGSNRFETQMEIYEYGVERNLWQGTPVVATGWNYADALGISAYTAANSSPLFLVGYSGSSVGILPEAQSALREDYASTSVIIVGGTAVVSSSTESWIETATGSDAIRLAGGTQYGNSYPENRFGTSAAVANYMLENGSSAEVIGVATGWNYADALVAGPAIGRSNGILLLVSANNNPSYSLAASIDLSSVESIADQVGGITEDIWFFGGDTDLSPVPRTIRNQILEIINK